MNLVDGEYTIKLLENGNIEVPTEYAKELLDGGSELFEPVKDAITGSSRWSIEYEAIYRHKETGKLYGSGYRVGATEMQDESPYEYDGDSVIFYECEEYMAPAYRAIKK